MASPATIAKQFYVKWQLHQVRTPRSQSLHHPHAPAHDAEPVCQRGRGDSWRTPKLAMPSYLDNYNRSLRSGKSTTNRFLMLSSTLRFTKLLSNCTNIYFLPSVVPLMRFLKFLFKFREFFKQNLVKRQFVSSIKCSVFRIIWIINQ